jgi:hypothetical protein
MFSRMVAQRCTIVTKGVASEAAEGECTECIAWTLNDR